MGLQEAVAQCLDQSQSFDNSPLFKLEKPDRRLTDKDMDELVEKHIRMIGHTNPGDVRETGDPEE